MEYCDKIFIGDVMGGLKYTTKSFITKAKNVHQDEYDYSLVDYQGSMTKVIISCKIHGEFQQVPNNHLNGNGCPECRYIKSAKNHTLNTEKFIERARRIHGDKYDYAKTDYISAMTKIIITCHKHGDFPQRPNTHLNGIGCPQCGYARRKSDTNRFIDKAKRIHEDKYSYDKVDYTYSNVKVIITCSIHGDFAQQPNTHLNGAGCPSCKESKGEKRVRDVLVKNDIPFIREFKLPNSGMYEYDFYLPRHKLIIEFHGKQHFEPISFFGGEKRLEYTKQCDTAKAKIAQLAKVPMIEFTYKDLELPEEEFETLVIDTIKKIILPMNIFSNS